MKQYSLHHAQRRDANADDEKDLDPPPFPHLWIISSGSPDSLIEAMRLCPMDGWPKGCFAGRPFDLFHLVVLRKLPRTPETLLLRLLSRGKTFDDATDDVVQVSEAAATSEFADVMQQVMRVLIAFRDELDQDQLEEDDMEALRDIDAAYEKWETQGQSRGEDRGQSRNAHQGYPGVLPAL